MLLYRIGEVAPLRLPSLDQLNQFDLSSCDLYDSDSVVLPVLDVTSYLEKTLQVLGLHTEARTSFITCVLKRPFRLHFEKLI